MSEEVMKALAVMNGTVGMKTELTNPKETLKRLSVLPYRLIDALEETGKEEDFLNLINVTANTVNETYHRLLVEGKQHKLHWGETREEMENVIRAHFPDWFEKADKIVRRWEIRQELKKELNSLISRVKRFTTALISTEEEAETRKAEIRQQFSKWLDKVVQNELNEEKEALEKEWVEALQECLQFVDKKLAEEPAHLLYYKTGNRVSVKVNLHKNEYTSYGRGVVRYNKGEDRDKFPLIVSVGYIEGFLYANGVRDEDIYVDPMSVDRFYSFEEVVSVNLTPAFVKEWYNRDCPILYRHTPNKDRSTNMLGMPICHFSTVLIESSWSTVYVDESLTGEEVERLIRGHEDTRIAREIRNMLEAKGLKESGELKRIEAEVEAFDQKVQAVIDKHAPMILNALANRYPHVSKWKKSENGEEKLYINENVFGLDCGFLYVRTTDPDYNKKRSLIRNAKPSVSPWMNVHMPYGCQSTTLQRAQFEIVKPIVERELGVILVGHTVLD
ncbi:hypothetical protein [Caldibacillus debilis]|uniref:Uncharacterized protein n=1 Tax=Caldibacillus debilis GB1 TaxID=1339248 RepID=A0A420VDV1_9BACI|nr:hypothetical protein [Caldibacillus debilis]RKO61857.1 hypothetical protein Cdeb_01352 [Caldibacillus debilis GB1]